MENSFLKLIEQKREEYKTWDPVYCPVLKQEVRFTIRGFNHIRFRKGNLPRDPKEISTRMNLLPLVRTVLRNAKVVTRYRKRLTKEKGIYKEIEYWAVDAPLDKKGMRVQVVLRKAKGAEHIQFWSVMKKRKQKSSPRG